MHCRHRHDKVKTRHLLYAANLTYRLHEYRTRSILTSILKMLLKINFPVNATSIKFSLSNKKKLQG